MLSFHTKLLLIFFCILYGLSSQIVFANSCDKHGKNAKNYFHREYTQAVDDAGQIYILDPYQGTDWPQQFRLRLCTDGVSVPIAGLADEFTEGVEKVFWSKNTQALYFVQESLSPETLRLARVNRSYSPDSIKMYLYKDEQLTLFNEYGNSYFYDTNHHPVMLIDEGYVNSSGKQMEIEGLVGRHQLKDLPEENWFYEINNDDGYSYANVIKLEFIDNKLIATQKIHFQERRAWWMKLLIWLFDQNKTWHASDPDIVIITDDTSNIDNVYFDVEVGKLYYNSGQKKIYFTVPDKELLDSALIQ